MTPRKPAKAAEIVELLRANDEIKKGRALPYQAAVRFLRFQLRTTQRNAMEWLSRATLEEPHEFELIGVVDGRISYLERGEDSILLDEADYPCSEFKKYWPNLTRLGEPVKNGRETGDEDFVVLSNDLRNMCIQAAEYGALDKATDERIRERDAREIEARHGQSLAYLRGLLQAAGVGIDEDHLSVRFVIALAGDHVNLKIRLKDTAIDAVAEVLAAHDIEPWPLERLMTLKPTASDRAPEAVDSV